MNKLIIFAVLVVAFIACSEAVTRANDDKIQSCTTGDCASDSDTEALCNVNTKVKVQRYKNKCVAKCAAPVSGKQRNEWLGLLKSCDGEYTWGKSTHLAHAEDDKIKSCTSDDCADDSDSNELCHFHVDLDLQVLKNKCVATCAAPFHGAKVNAWVNDLTKCSTIKF